MSRKLVRSGTPSVTLVSIDELEREGLLALWSALVGSPVPRAISQPMLRRILAFDLQAQQQGGLSKAVLRTLATPATPKAETPRSQNAGHLRPGGRLIREWAGVSHVVDVTEEGYLWQGKTFRSLSAIAAKITGAHWSGPRFFGLNRKADGKVRTKTPSGSGAKGIRP